MRRVNPEGGCAEHECSYGVKVDTNIVTQQYQLFQPVAFQPLYLNKQHHHQSDHLVSVDYRFTASFITPFTRAPNWDKPGLVKPGSTQLSEFCAHAPVSRAHLSREAAKRRHMVHFHLSRSKDGHFSQQRLWVVCKDDFSSTNEDHLPLPCISSLAASTSPDALTCIELGFGLD